MAKVNMHEAKTHFSKLVELALQGEEVIIARSGKPVVRLVPVDESTLRPFGLDCQETDDDFVKRSLEPLSEEELALWYNPKLLSDE